MTGSSPAVGGVTVGRSRKGERRCDTEARSMRSRSWRRSASRWPKVAPGTRPGIPTSRASGVRSATPRDLTRASLGVPRDLHRSSPMRAVDCQRARALLFQPLGSGKYFALTFGAGPQWITKRSADDDIADKNGARRPDRQLRPPEVLTYSEIVVPLSARGMALPPARPSPLFLRATDTRSTSDGRRIDLMSEDAPEWHQGSVSGRSGTLEARRPEKRITDQLSRSHGIARMLIGCVTVSLFLP